MNRSVAIVTTVIAVIATIVLAAYMFQKGCIEEEGFVERASGLSYMDRLVAPLRGKVFKDFTQKWKAVPFESTHVYDAFFADSVIPMIENTEIKEGRSVLTGVIPRRHPYFDTFIAMEATETNVPRSIQDAMVMKEVGWKELLSTVFEETRVSQDGSEGVVVQLREYAIPEAVYAMFERLAIAKINNHDTILQRLESNMIDMSNLEKEVETHERRAKKLSEDLQAAQRDNLCKGYALRYIDANRTGNDVLIKATLEGLQYSECDIPATGSNDSVAAADHAANEKTEDIASLKKCATDVEAAIANTDEWQMCRSAAVEWMLSQPDITQQQRVRLENDGALIKRLRAGITGLRDQQRKSPPYLAKVLEQKGNKIIKQAYVALNDIFSDEA